MSEYPQQLNELLEDFKDLDNNQRMDMLIYYAEDFEEVPSEIATRPYDEKHKVVSCESQAYVWARKNNNAGIDFHFAVENPQGVSAKAMAAILSQTVSGLPASEIVKINTDLVFELFGRNLSMGKNAGLTGMIEQVVRDAKSFL